MFRGLALALALLCAGCLSWTSADAHYFADLSAYGLGAEAKAVMTPAAATHVASTPAAAAPRAPDLAIDEPNEVDFACADGARLRLTYSPDRSHVVAQWSDGGRYELKRQDHEGLIRYVSTGVEFWRAGRRAAWISGGSSAAAAADVRVEAGDTLWKISERIYGTRARALDIARANADRVADPNLIYPGQVLRLPDSQQAQSRRYCARPLGPA